MYKVKVMSDEYVSVHEEIHFSLRNALVKAERWHKAFPYNNIKINNEMFYLAKDKTQ